MKSNSVTLNNEQQLFVISSGSGPTCLGYAVCVRHLSEMLSLMGRADTQPPQGTLESYQLYVQTCGEFAQSPASAKTYFGSSAVPQALRKVLERARKDDTSVRLMMGDPATGKHRLEEYDVAGRIGRSTGTLKVPLMIEEINDDGSIRKAHGGDAIPCDRILAVIDCESGTFLYRARTYSTPHISVVNVPGSEYPWQVVHDTKTHANFKTYEEASSLAAFLQGHKTRKALRTLSEYNDDFAEAA